MTQFQASLIASGDPQPLPTTIELNEGTLTIESNGQAIGDWPVADLEFERIVGGFRVKLDGEVAVLKLTESDQFNQVLTEFNSVKADKTKPPKKEKRAKEPKVSRSAARAESRGAAVATAPASTSATEPASRPESGPTFMEKLDARLEQASKKWDRYLPDWVFTRGGVAVGVVFLIAVLVLHQFFSYLFLIVAAIGLITSAIALLDQVIATRIFRGGFTPIHGLIGSLALFLLSLLLAAL